MLLGRDIQDRQKTLNFYPVRIERAWSCVLQTKSLRLPFPPSARESMDILLKKPPYCLKTVADYLKPPEIKLVRFVLSIQKPIRFTKKP